MGNCLNCFNEPREEPPISESEKTSGVFTNRQKTGSAPMSEEADQPSVPRSTSTPTFESEQTSGVFTNRQQTGSAPMSEEADQPLVPRSPSTEKEEAEELTNRQHPRRRRLLTGVEIEEVEEIEEIEKVEESRSTSRQEREEELSVTRSTPTFEEVIQSLKAVSDIGDLNECIPIIKQLFDDVKSNKGCTTVSAIESKKMRTSLVTSGGMFIEFVNDYSNKSKDKKDLYFKTSSITEEILVQVGQSLWVAGGLGITSFLLATSDGIYANKAEAVELLSNMVDLATSIVELRNVLPQEEEKLKQAVMLITEGSIYCIYQIRHKLSRLFWTASLDFKILKRLSNRLSHLYRDLTLTMTKTMVKRQSEMAECLSEMAKSNERHQLEMAIRIEKHHSEMAEYLSASECKIAMETAKREVQEYKLRIAQLESEMAEEKRRAEALERLLDEAERRSEGCPSQTEFVDAIDLEREEDARALM